MRYVVCWVSSECVLLAIPEARREGEKFSVQFCRKWSCEPSMFQAKSLRISEKNPHKLYIVQMLNGGSWQTFA